MRQLLYILLLFCTASASAYDFEVDGIYYNILESELWEHENPTVEVTYGQIGGRGKEATPTYVGDMEIPAYVMWEGTEYQVIGIGYYAFSLTDVSAVKMPEGLVFIDDAAFYYSGLGGDVRLPSTLTFIGNYAFSSCEMTSIVIPNSVEFMGESVFDGCVNLRYAVLSSNQKTVPTGTFNNCEWLTEVVIPYGIESIEGMAFNNTSVKLHDLPESLVRIASSAFAGCNFSGVFLPYSLTDLGTGVFRDCTWLTYASIPRQISKLPDYTFYNCYSLKNVTIPKNIREIGDYAFFMPRYIKYGDGQIWWGSDLATIYIMGDVSYIGKYAFGRNDGTSLDDFYCYSSVVPQADSTTFRSSAQGQQAYVDVESCVFNATLHVPASLIHEYQNTYPWNQFARIVALTDNVRPMPEPERFASYKMSELRGYSIDSTCYYLYNIQTKSFFCYDKNTWSGKIAAHLGVPATKVFFLRYPQHIFDGSVKICYPGYEDYSWVVTEGVDNDVFMVKDMGDGVYRIGLSEQNRDLKPSRYPNCYMGFDQYEGALSIGEINFLLEPGTEPEGHTYCVDWKLVPPAEYNRIAAQLYACSSAAYLKQLIDSTAILHPRINVDKIETAYFDISLSGAQLDSVRNVLQKAISLSEYMNELKVAYPTIDLSEASKLLSHSDFTIADIEAVRKQLDIAVRRVDVLAVIGGATEQNPKSATELIQNPAFEINYRWWEYKNNSQQQQYVGYDIEKVQTMQGSGIALSNFMLVVTPYNNAESCYPSLKAALGNGEMYNTLIGLPNGRYVLECDAVTTNRTIDLSTELLTGVYLFVRSSGTETLTPIKTNGMVPRHFTNEFYISSGDTIYFGIKTLNTTANYYAMDNYTLTYYGETDTDAYHGTLMSRLNTFDRLYPDIEHLKAAPELKQAFNETFNESDIILGDYITEEYTTAMNAVEEKAAALNRSVSNYINAALLCQFCEQERDHYAQTEYTDLADQLGDLAMTLESGYLDCNLDELLQETYQLTIDEVYEYIQNLITQVTGIDERSVKSEERSVKNGFYTLQGQRINRLQKGLNIVDGKKVFVK